MLCRCYVEVCADILFTLLGLTSISNFTFDDYNQLRLQTLHYCRCVPDLGPKRLTPWHIIAMSGERKSEKGGVLEHYLALPQPEDRVQCTYVWIDGTGESLRSKTKTVNFIPKTPKGERWELSNKCIHNFRFRASCVEFWWKLFLSCRGEQFWCLPSPRCPLQRSIQVIISLLLRIISKDSPESNYLFPGKGITK